MNIEKIVKLLLSELEKKDQNISDLAHAIGISQGTLSKIIRFRVKTPTHETLKAIAKYFQVSLSTLLDDINGANESKAYSSFPEDEQKLLKTYRELKTISQEAARGVVEYAEFRLSRNKSQKSA